MMRTPSILLRPPALVAALGLLFTGHSHAQTSLLAELTPSDPSSGRFFGAAVALDGEFAALKTQETNDPAIAGSVEIMRDDPASGWVLETRIESPPWSTALVPIFGFGDRLSIDGDTLLVGNNYGGTVPESREVYVYRRDAVSATWSREGTLVYPGSDTFPLFGPASDIEGDTAIVGSPFGNFGTDPNANSKGAIYVYERSGGSWTYSEALTLEPSVVTRIGRDVRIVGDRILALTQPLGPQGPRGVVVFAQDGSGAWNQEAFLEPFLNNDVRVDAFEYDGRTLAIESSVRLGVITIGNFSFTEFAPLIVSYRRLGSAWTRLPDIQPTLPPSEDRSSIAIANDLGFLPVPESRIAVRGDRIYYGSRASSVGLFGGGVEVFEYDGTGWQFDGDLLSPGLREGDLLGSAIAQDEGRLLVAAIGREDPTAGDPALNTGAAYLFRVDDAPLESYCQATPLACTACPCGNEAAAGTDSGCTNSSGMGARLVGSGQPLPLDDSLRFDLEGAAPSSFAFLAVGTTPLPNLGAFCPPGSGVVGTLLDGKRCIGGGLRRLGLRAVDAQGTVGVTTAPWGVGNAPVGGLIAASGGTFGATLYYQAFYRDNGTGSCGTGVNTSNGVRALLLP